MLEDTNLLPVQPKPVRGALARCEGQNMPNSKVLSDSMP